VRKNINIAGNHAWSKEKGSDAISVIGIDDKLDDNALEELKKLPNILEVSLIKL
jgi:L-serine deaminase